MMGESPRALPTEEEFRDRRRRRRLEEMERREESRRREVEWPPVGMGLPSDEELEELSHAEGRD